MSVPQIIGKVKSFEQAICFFHTQPDEQVVFLDQKNGKEKNGCVIFQVRDLPKVIVLLQKALQEASSFSAREQQ